MKKPVAVLMLSIMLFCCSTSALASCSGQTVSGVYSKWSSNPTGYTNWNCYGYAIGAYQNIDPGSLSGYGVNYYNMTWTQFKNAVKQDLAYLGYTNISEVSSGYVLQPGEWIIAGVSGNWTSDVLFLSEADDASSHERTYDGKGYHFFVKYTNGGGWFHKYGTSSSIMKLKGSYTPSSITVTSEYFTSSTNYISSVSHYTGSNLVYIKFQTGVPVSVTEGATE